MDTPRQSDSAEQEDLPEVDSPGETIRPNTSEEAESSTEVETSGEVDSPEEAKPLKGAIDEVLQAALDAAILAARPSNDQSGSHSGCEAIERSEWEWGRMWWWGGCAVGAHLTPGKKEGRHAN